MTNKNLLRDALEPCPHCRSSDVFVERSDFSACFVQCNDCLARGPVAVQESDDEEVPGFDAAIKVWNRRAAPLPAQPQGQGEATGEEIIRLGEVLKEAEKPTAIRDFYCGPPSQAPEPAQDMSPESTHPENVSKNGSEIDISDHIGDVNEMIQPAPQAAVQSDHIAGVGNMMSVSDSEILRIRAYDRWNDDKTSELIYAEWFKRNPCEEHKRGKALVYLDDVRALARTAPVVAEGFVIAPQPPCTNEFVADGCERFPEEPS